MDSHKLLQKIKALGMAFPKSFKDLITIDPVKILMCKDDEYEELVKKKQYFHNNWEKILNDPVRQKEEKLSLSNLIKSSLSVEEKLFLFDVKEQNLRDELDHFKFHATSGIEKVKANKRLIENIDHLNECRETILACSEFNYTSKFIALHIYYSVKAGFFSDPTQGDKLKLLKEYSTSLGYRGVSIKSISDDYNKVNSKKIKEILKTKPARSVGTPTYCDLLLRLDGINKKSEKSNLSLFDVIQKDLNL